MAASAVSMVALSLAGCILLIAGACLAGFLFVVWDIVVERTSEKLINSDVNDTIRACLKHAMLPTRSMGAVVGHPDYVSTIQAKHHRIVFHGSTAPRDIVVAIESDNPCGYSEADISVSYSLLKDNGLFIVRTSCFRKSINYLFRRLFWTSDCNVPVDKLCRNAGYAATREVLGPAVPLVYRMRRMVRKIVARPLGRATVMKVIFSLLEVRPRYVIAYKKEKPSIKKPASDKCNPA